MLLHKALQVEHVCTPHCGAAQALRRHMDGPVLLLGLLRLWRKNKAQQGSRTQVLLWCDRIQVGGFPSAPAWPPPSVVTYSCLKLLLEAAGRDVWYQPIGSLLGGTPAARRGPHPAECPARGWTRRAMDTGSLKRPSRAGDGHPVKLVSLGGAQIGHGAVGAGIDCDEIG